MSRFARLHRIGLRSRDSRTGMHRGTHATIRRGEPLRHRIRIPTGRRPVRPQGERGAGDSSSAEVPSRDRHSAGHPSRGRVAVDVLPRGMRNAVPPAAWATRTLPIAAGPRAGSGWGLLPARVVRTKRARTRLSRPRPGSPAVARAWPSGLRYPPAAVLAPPSWAIVRWRRSSWRSPTSSSNSSSSSQVMPKRICPISPALRRL